MPPISAMARGKTESFVTPMAPNRKEGFTTNTAPTMATRIAAHWKPSAASFKTIIDVSTAKKGESLFSIIASDMFVWEIA